MNNLESYAKDDVKDRIRYLSPAALIILCDLVMYCEQKQYHLVISDAVTDVHEDMALNRISSTHREGRAFDISAKDLTREMQLEIKRVFASKYKHLAAVDGIGDANLIVIHDAGTGEHLHFQVHKRYALPLRTFNKFDDLNKLG